MALQDIANCHGLSKKHIKWAWQKNLTVFEIWIHFVATIKTYDGY